MAILVFTASRLATRRLDWRIALGMTSESFIKFGSAVGFYAGISMRIGTSLLFYFAALEICGGRTKWTSGYIYFLSEFCVGAPIYASAKFTLGGCTG